MGGPRAVLPKPEGGCEGREFPALPSDSEANSVTGRKDRHNGP